MNFIIKIKNNDDFLEWILMQATSACINIHILHCFDWYSLNSAIACVKNKNFYWHSTRKSQEQLKTMLKNHKYMYNMYVGYVELLKRIKSREELTSYKCIHFFFKYIYYFCFVNLLFLFFHFVICCLTIRVTNMIGNPFVSEKKTVSRQPFIFNKHFPDK